jgi:hypothetical protein
MHFLKICLVGLSAVVSLQVAAEPVNSSGAESVFKRRTVSILNQGKEVSHIVLPFDVPSNPTWTAKKTKVDVDGTVHLRGNVLLMLTIDKRPFSLQGDEMTLRGEALDDEEAQAVRDLAQMGLSDQSLRGNPSTMTAEQEARQALIDKANMQRLEAIIKRFGWPGNRFAGIQNAKSAFLVLQHADTASQHQYLPVLRAAVTKGEADGSDLAMLEDRVRVGDGKPQLYGTQFISTNPLVLCPIENEAHLDQRRSELGMLPMAQYMKLVKDMYKSN